MWGWLTGWYRPTAKKIEVVPSAKEEVKENAVIIYRKGHYTLSPLRILEWWGQTTTLDPIAPFPDDSDTQKNNVPQ